MTSDVSELHQKSEALGVVSVFVDKPLPHGIERPHAAMQAVTKMLV